jgi:hypothetical protein
MTNKRQVEQRSADVAPCSRSRKGRVGGGLAPPIQALVVELARIAAAEDDDADRRREVTP